MNHGSRSHAQEAGVKTVAQRSAEWIVRSDTGLSSKTIYAHMLGATPQKSRWGGPDACYPRDPDDLGRCLRLLELIPEWKGRIAEMAVYGPYWAALVAQWEQLSESMIAEVGIDWSKGQRAERTYQLMLEIIGRVRDETTTAPTDTKTATGT